MNIDNFLGPAMPELGWVPSPRYTLRRIRVIQMMKDVRPGRLLEVGPGAGALLIEYSLKGFQCEALETSDEARKLLRASCKGFDVNIPVHPMPRVEWESKFDVLFALEVLEHIENDEEAISQWVSWLRPKGVLLLSVPARMKLWGARDEWAGHFRRYEKESLIALLRNAGLEVKVFECYGFPLSNLTERISSYFLKDNIKHDAEEHIAARKSKSERSGIDRSLDMQIYPVLNSASAKLALRIFSEIQGIFVNKDLGSGYLVMARCR